MGFRHVVLFRWSAESTPEQRAGAVAGLQQWGTDAKEYGTLVVGSDAGLVEGNFDTAVTVDLPDRDTYRAYAADPRHQAMIAEHIRPILAERAAVQHET